MSLSLAAILLHVKECTVLYSRGARTGSIDLKSSQWQDAYVGSLRRFSEQRIAVYELTVETFEPDAEIVMAIIDFLEHILSARHSLVRVPIILQSHRQGWPLYVWRSNGSWADHLHTRVGHRRQTLCHTCTRRRRSRMHVTSMASAGPT